jgi:hypothetical protein
VPYSGQRDKYPLLSDWIAQQQPTPEERILKADESIIWQQQYWRDCSARCWRKWRARLYRLSLPERQLLLSEWNDSHYYYKGEIPKGIKRLHRL